MVQIANIIRWFRSWVTPDAIFQFVDETSGIAMPRRGSKEAAGLDLYCSERVRIQPGMTAIVKTGVKCQFNRGWAAMIWDRSGLGARGVHRFAGLIDSDYRGEWGVVLHNSKKEIVIFNEGDRIAQVVFQRVWLGTPKMGLIDSTERGSGGFGSTGS